MMTLTTHLKIMKIGEACPFVYNYLNKFYIYILKNNTMYISIFTIYLLIILTRTPLLLTKQQRMIRIIHFDNVLLFKARTISLNSITRIYISK